jgi:hypothetical protein
METQKSNGKTSGEPWEIEFVHRQFPTHSENEIIRVVDECKKELQGSTNRDEIMKCVERKFA